MHNFLKQGLVLLALYFLSACATTQNYQRMLDEWQGATLQKLMQVWGYPDAGIKLPNGNSVYIYTRQHTFIAPPAPMMTPTFINMNNSSMPVMAFNSSFMGGQTLALYCRTWFEVNPQGVIVNHRYAGNNCVAAKHAHSAPAD